jgi:hypothetical protein
MAEQLLDEWQAAVEALLLVVELNSPTMMERLGVMRALNRHVEWVSIERAKTSVAVGGN